MLASNIASHLAAITPKQQAAASKRAAKRALLPAPVVVPDIYHGPLKCELRPTVVKVDVEYIDVAYPSERAPLAVESERAAIRAQLVNANDFGTQTHVAVMVVDGDTVRTIILEGSHAAVRQAFPDQLAVAELAKAGATEFLRWGFDQSIRRTVERVGIFQAPRALQAELETRCLAAQVLARAAVKLTEAAARTDEWDWQLN
jgi:hypothetical protein